jgi:hypothetical protein
MPKKYILYQLEQLQQSKLLTDRYLDRIKKSIKTLDYNKLNKIEGVELLYQPIPIDLNTIFIDKYEYDVLFCGNIHGSTNSRRPYILNMLKRHFKVKICYEVFKEEMYEMISKAKIILNIHYFDNALLETPRINESLKFNNIIISEYGIDDAHLNYEGIVNFIDVITNNCDELINTIKYNLDNFDTIIKKKRDLTKLYNLSKEYLIKNITNI